MSVLAENSLEMDSNLGFEAQKEYKSAYLTIINFLKFVDDGSCFTEKYLKDRFSHRLHLRIMLDKLISLSILKKSNEGNYVLNIESNNLLSPSYENTLFVANVNKNNKTSDLSLKFIFN